MKPYIFGIDLGGTSIKTGLFDSLTKNLIEKWEIPTRTKNHGEYIIPDIAENIKSKLSSLKIDLKDVEGLGMDVPGAVLRDGYVTRCVNLDDWGGFYPSEALEKLMGFPVKVMNDANVAALGEYAFGGGKGYQSQVFVTLGTGVGGGTIINGQILVGSHGAAGEIGHIKARFDETRVCGCGKRGCVEQYASATGVVATARLLLAKDDTPSLLRDIPKDDLDCKTIFDLAKEGDELALKCVDNMGIALGHMLASVSACIDPEVIVIGGGVAKAGEIIIDAVGKYFREAAFSVCEDTKIVLAKLGNDAGIYGCFQLIFGAQTL